MIEPLPYRADTALLFQNLLGLPGCVYLDSGGGSPFAGRYDILAADPYVTLTTRDQVTEIASSSGRRMSHADPLELLKEALGGIEPRDEDLPFAGGAIGYFSYDLGRRFEAFSGSAVRDIEMPEMQVGLYDWALVVDHERHQSFLVAGGRDPRTRMRWNDIRSLFDAAHAKPAAVFEVVSGVQSNFDYPAYVRAFEQVQDHIRRGDCYQINLAQRFAASVRGDSWNAYRALRTLNPAPFSAYLGTPFGDVLCSSPERFLQVERGTVQSKPIKGTRPRSGDPDQDRALRDELAHSAKDQAENVMIVDLLRNDLGKSCEAGSVEVSQLFAIESFAQVHHLVSTVSGRLRADRHALDLLRGCFPGGSITGAPKLSAMRIIDALEPHRRSVYCGSIGYLGFNGQMDFNIAIRTLLRSGNSIYAWAGGGIVADSDADSEYQECFHKASGLLAVLSESTVSAVS